MNAGVAAQELDGDAELRPARPSSPVRPVRCPWSARATSRTQAVPVLGRPFIVSSLFKVAPPTEHPGCPEPVPLDGAAP